MDIRALEYFLALADTGSATRAAAQCFVTQPSLSRQIQALEREAGTALFERQPRGMILTRAGRILEPQVREHLYRHRDLVGVLGSLRDQELRLRVACPLMISLEAVLPYMAEHASPIVDVIETAPDDAYEYVLRNEVDLAITTWPPPAGLRRRLLFETPLYAQVGPELFPEDPDAIELADLVGLPLFTSDGHSGVRAIFDREVVASGLEMTIAGEATHIQVAQALASSRRGVAIGVSAAAHGLRNIPLVNNGTPILAQDWVAWSSSHYAAERIEPFLDELLGWLSGQLAERYLPPGVHSLTIVEPDA
ncbi:LysR family transcriptional regulator [Leucobacter sp. M11]|uniref:LysR family transcriptional regulator n=1 Tax=Leucobacter sp. M11 TaxID=2993565 RepID=UPI002D7E6CE3|nr:LysR family transcriptional regulator [Leucobacter sp. M11]MEB4615690.1 LysR family transcriptional regulator [Leucobacter sp. M11]